MTSVRTRPPAPGTRLAKLVAAWDAGEKARALAIAADFGELGAEGPAIRRGASARLSPDFYRELGQDPDALVDAAYDAIARRYGLDG